jgi:hypothetical protein
MSSPRARGVAWIAPVLAIAIVATRLIARPQTDVAVWVFNLAFLVYAVVGGLIVAREPRNAVGWLFCLIGVMFASGELYSDYQASADSAAGATAFAVATTAGGGSSFLIVAIALMLFPTGHFSSPRWRRAAIALIAANVAWTVVLGLEPGPLSTSPDIDNPLGIESAAGLLHTLADVGGVVLAATLIAAIASVVARFRAARGIERQQLKWLAFAGAVSAVVLAVLFGLGAVLDLDTGLGRVVAGTLLGVLLAAPPVAAAIAILRYRLYDVDVVLNRALVYGVLTATLAASYLALVLLIGLAVGGSGFAVAVSTLAVAALFRPARARIQAAVDRRFYRRRYDAAHALAGFGARLRDQVELDALSRELRGVVDECLQPAHVSLWLRSTRLP